MTCVSCPNEVSPRAKNTRGQCTKCSEKYHDAKRRSNPERKKYMSAMWKRPDVLENHRKWLAEHPEAVKTYHQRKRKKNPHVYRALDAKRRASEIRAMPPWVNKEEIKKIYRDCPEGYHVDHIVPLNNPNVCGLHVPANLQAIPAEENVKKGNKFNG